MENLKFVQRVNSKREDEQNKPEKSFFSINAESTTRFKSENWNIPWDIELGLLCDEDTFNWISEHCNNNILIITNEHIEKLKTFHFYKEIILSF